MISLSVLEYPLLDAHWAGTCTATHSGTVVHGTGEMLDQMGREEAFACVAIIQTRSSNIEPDDLQEVRAISFDNSIFVAAALLTDLHTVADSKELRHIIGNVGFPGLNLMVAPAGGLKIRRAANEVRKLSHHSEYDFKRVDYFKESSLHLSFTGQRFPVIATDMDTIDQQSVVSLWEGGDHIADLNILDSQRKELNRVHLDCTCSLLQIKIQDIDIRCLDSWQDVLRPPRRMAVMRAHSNWSARLAATSIFLQQHKEHAVALLPPGPLCWNCLERFFGYPETHWPEILIN